MSAVLFDLDGTLADPFEGIAGCTRHALRALGEDVPTDARLRRCIGPPLREVFQVLLPTARPDRVEAAVRLYRERFDARGIYAIGVTWGFGGAAELAAAGASRLCADPAAVLTALRERFGRRAGDASGPDAAQIDRAARWPSKIARSTGRTATASPTRTTRSTAPSSSK